MKILVADDHALIREGLISALRDLDSPVSFVTAGDATETLTAIADHADLDLILLDLFMPGAGRFGLLSRLVDSCPEVPIVVLSASENPAHVRKAIDLGAAGFIPKSSPRDVMLNALRLVLSGGLYVPYDLLTAPPAPADSPVVDQPPLFELTRRQTEVLGMLGGGHSNKAIARRLGLAENTVKIHVASILRSLGVSNRTKAGIIAREAGLA